MCDIEGADLYPPADVHESASPSDRVDDVGSVERLGIPQKGIGSDEIVAVRRGPALPRPVAVPHLRPLLSNDLPFGGAHQRQQGDAHDHRHRSRSSSRGTAAAAAAAAAVSRLFVDPLVFRPCPNEHAHHHQPDNEHFAQQGLQFARIARHRRRRRRRTFGHF